MEISETVKKQLIGLAFPILNKVVVSMAKYIYKKKKKDVKVKAEGQVIAVKENVKKAKKTVKKESKKLIRKALFSLMVKEFVLDRVWAKINPKPTFNDYSWLMKYPVSKTLINLKSQISNLKKDEVILDLGSGSGYFAIEAAKHLTKGKVFCLDVNLKLLKLSHFKADDQGLNNLEFHRANIENLPFKNEQFDTAFLNITFGQLRDKARAMSEINRVIRKGGYLYINDVLVDDYYTFSSTVLSYVLSSGFKLINEEGKTLSYTLVFKKE